MFLIPVTVVTFSSAPKYPQNLMPYVFLALMIVGFVVMTVLGVRQPEVLAQYPSETARGD